MGQTLGCLWVPIMLLKRHGAYCVRSPPAAQAVRTEDPEVCVALRLRAGGGGACHSPPSPQRPPPTTWGGNPDVRPEKFPHSDTGNTGHAPPQPHPEVTGDRQARSGVSGASGTRTPEPPGRSGGRGTHRVSRLEVPLRSGNSWMSVAPFRDLETEPAARGQGRSTSPRGGQPSGVVSACPRHLSPPSSPACCRQPRSARPRSHPDGAGGLGARARKHQAGIRGDSVALLRWPRAAGFASPGCPLSPAPLPFLDGVRLVAFPSPPSPSCEDTGPVHLHVSGAQRRRCGTPSGAPGSRPGGTRGAQGRL